MALRDVVKRLRMPTDDLDRGKRAARPAELGCTPINAVVDRQQVELVGTVRSVRIVPRAGAPSLDVTVDDGHGLALAVFYGRRSIAGLGAGVEVHLSGRASIQHGRPTLINPAYELL